MEQESSSTDDPDNAKLAPSGAALIDCRSGLTSDQRKPVGWVVALPQGPRANRDGGASGYGTTEWVREVVYTNLYDNIQNAQAALPRPRLENDPDSVGCGLVSSNVPISMLTPNQEGGFTETPLRSQNPNGFYTLVPSGNYDDPVNETGLIETTEVWFSDAPWPENMPSVIQAKQRSAKAGSA